MKLVVGWRSRDWGRWEYEFMLNVNHGYVGVASANGVNIVYTRGGGEGSDKRGVIQK